MISRLELGASTLSWCIDVSGKLYYISRFEETGSRANLARETRARAAWRIAWRCWLASLPVPEPMVLLEIRRLGLLECSYLASQFIDGAVSLEDLWPRLEPAAREATAERLADVESRLRACGLLEGPLPRAAILLQRGAAGESLWLATPHRFLAHSPRS